VLLLREGTLELSSPLHFLMRNYRTLLNTFAHINRFPVPHHFLDMPDYVFSTFVYFEYDFIINKNK
jgi:hypothetical protein